MVEDKIGDHGRRQVFLHLPVPLPELRDGIAEFGVLPLPLVKRQTAAQTPAGRAAGEAWPWVREGLRADAARSMPGSGLGLAIVAEVAAVHGGQGFVEAFR